MVVAHYTTTHGNDKKELLTTVNLLNERLHTDEYVKWWIMDIGI